MCVTFKSISNFFTGIIYIKLKRILYRERLWIMGFNIKYLLSREKKNVIDFYDLSFFFHQTFAEFKL